MIPTIELVPRQMRRYVGVRPPLDDQVQRAHQMAFTLMTECMSAAETPFARIARNGLLLCDETERYIYHGNYGHLSKPYRHGSRPMLEAYIDSVVTRDMDDAEKVIALNEAIEDLPQRFGQTPAFLYGESDEQTLLKGGGHCSCRARLLTSLCQILGLEARPVLFWIRVDPEQPDRLRGGHTVTEVRVDGQWGFFDPMARIYCRTADGRFPSIAELRRRPEVFLEMPARRTMRPTLPPLWGMNFFEYFAYRFFSTDVPCAVSRHEVNDDDCTIRWNWATDEFRARQQHDHARNKQLLLELASRGELTDEIYAMGLDEFRHRFGITDGQMTSLWGTPAAPSDPDRSPVAPHAVSA